MTKERFRELAKRFHPDRNGGSNRYAHLFRSAVKVMGDARNRIKRCIDCQTGIAIPSLRCATCNRKVRFRKAKSALAACVVMCAMVALAPPSPQTDSVNLAWDSSSDPSVIGVMVYWGQGPSIVSGWNGTNVSYRVYTNSTLLGLVTNTTITGLTRGARYYFAVTARGNDLIGITESDYSNEVYKDVPKKPNGPSNLREQ